MEADNFAMADEQNQPSTRSEIAVFKKLVVFIVAPLAALAVVLPLFVLNANPAVAATATITQNSPTSASTTAVQSGFFSSHLEGTISVPGSSVLTSSVGNVTWYVNSGSSPMLSISSSGGIKTTAALRPGTYTASGTVNSGSQPLYDIPGGSGTWSFTLTVTGLNAPVVGMAQDSGSGGYWLVAADGGVFAYGNAQFYGSMAGQALASPIVGITSSADGGGYTLVAADGGVFCFGDATFYGSVPGGQAA